MRYTERHSGKAVIRDKALLSDAMEKLAKIEEMTDIPEYICDKYCKYREQAENEDELLDYCGECVLADLAEVLVD